jgi:hypothetical protein
MKIKQWLLDLEERCDEWARKRMPPEEFAEAKAFDPVFKRNFWPGVAVYFAVTTSLALLLWAVKPHLGFVEPFVTAQLLGFGLILTFAGAWFGYRRYARSGYWKSTLIIGSLAAAGAVVGALIASPEKGTLAAAMTRGYWAKPLAVGLLIGTVFAAVVTLIAWMRNREAKQLAARLRAEAETERLARQTVQAELKLLQAQIEPHFLFNTLANLRYLVTSGSKDALPMLDHLIHYLRSALPDLRSEGSTLGREAQLAEAYLSIMKLRMGGDFAFSIEVPEALAGVAFPSLMAMTLVENAVKHGIQPTGAGGRIELRAEAADGRLRVAVEDSGRGLAEPIGQGVGLANIRERLKALYGDAARLDLRATEPHGTVASIEIPFGLPQDRGA